MAGPWERYQTQSPKASGASGPWERYAAPQKEAAGFLGSLIENAQTLGIADEAAAFADNPSDENRRALIKAGESKYRQVGFGEGENWEAFKQLLGSSLGQLAAPVAAGLAAAPFTSPLGGLAAASATQGAQYTSQNLLRQAQEQEEAIAKGKKPEETSLGKAVLAATGQTAIDLAGGRVFSGIAKAFPFMKPLLGQAGGRAAEEAGEVLADAAANGTIKFAKGVATGVGKGVAFEVPTEIAQQGLERWQAGLSLSDEEAQSEYGQAALGALLLGGGFGGVSGALSARGEAAQTEAGVEAEVGDEAGAETGAAGVLTGDRMNVRQFERDVTARLAEAAGPELSPRATNAIAALGRVVSNDVATATPESLARSEQYIRDWMDDLGAGEYESEVIDPLFRAVVDETGAPVIDETTGQPAYQGALMEARRMLAEARRNLASAGETAPVTEPTTRVEPVEPMELTPQSYVDRYMAGEGRGDTAADLELQQYAANNAAEIEAEFARRSQQEAPAGGVEPEPMGVDEVPPTPPPPPPPPPVSSAAPAPKMEVAADWRIKFADQFGQSQLADNWAKSVLGTELSSELQTTPIIERVVTMQAGQQRLLQRNKFDPITEAAANLGVDIGDFNAFLWFDHAAERNREVAKTNKQFPEGGAGITTAAANEGLQNMAAEGLLPKYNILKRKVQDLVRFNLEEDVKAGLLSQEQMNSLLNTYENYVPLKGFAADGDIMTADIDVDADTGTRREEAMQAIRAASPGGSPQEFRRAIGRGSMPLAPLFNLMHDSEQRIRRRTLNKARLPILKQWKRNSAAFAGIFNVYTDTNPKKVVVGRDRAGNKYADANMKDEYYANRENYMVVKDKGVTYYVEFAASPEGQALRRMFMNMDPKDMEGAMRTVAEVNNFLKGMLTYKNPLYLTFIAPFRDMSSAIATAMYHQNLKGSPAYKKNLAARTAFYALPFTGTWSTIARFAFTGKPMNTDTGRQLEEFVREGGATLSTRFVNLQERTEGADQAIRKMRGVENLSAKERGSVILEGLNKWIDALADLMDMSARFATYRASVDLGILPADAARLSLDSSLNLTRRGEKARNLDLIFPFFGAGVEAARKTKRIYTSKGGAKVLGALLAYGALESLWNAAHSGDDDGDGKEDYLNLDSSNMRMNRLTLYYGSGADDYVKIPIDPMVGYFKFVGNRIGDLMADTVTPGDATAGLLTGAIGVMSPLRIPQADLPAATVAFTPLVGKPIMENILNQNFFGSPIYKETQFDNAPGSELGRASTGEGWKWLARTVNDATGGSEAVKGKVDFQPEIYRHMVEGYLGGPYQLAKQMAGLGQAEGATDIPGIKSFVGSGSEYAPQTQYFENSTIVRQITNRLSKLTPEQQMAQGAEFFMDTDPRIMDAYKAVDANLDRISKEERASLALATNEEDKKAVLDYYRAQKNEYYSAFNFVYNAVKKGE